MHLGNFLAEMRDVESNYGQTVRWQAESKAEHEISEKRLAIIESLVRRCQHAAQYPDTIESDERFKARLDEIARCDKADMLRMEKKLAFLVRDLNAGFEKLRAPRLRRFFAQFVQVVVQAE